MRFIQTMEFEGTQEGFEKLLARYRELAGAETKVRRAVLCADRDKPGTLIEFVEFDSHDDAMANNELPATQRWAEEASSQLGTATFRNLDVLGEYTP